jgi:hypothetical protein
MIVRELLTVFSLDYDGKGQAQAERGIKGLIAKATSLQTTFTSALAATAISAPFIGLIKMASDAQENLNLLQVVFKDSAQDVVEWSNRVSGEVGRSRYTLRGLAAEFGGLVGAMVGPGEQAAKMSTGLAELAINLTSLRNFTGGEKRALEVLQSAMAGETEAIKRFGPDLSVAAQETEALRLGFAGTYKELTKSQKAQIRYNLLVKDLAFVQGDAANTLNQFANSSRAFRDQLKDIATELGLFLVPAAEDLLKTARGLLGPIAEGARSFRAFAADTNLAKAALIALGVVLAAVLLPPLLAALPLIAGFAALVLVIDDVITYIQGGNSVLEEFVGWLHAIDAGEIEDINPVLKTLVGWFFVALEAVKSFGSKVGEVFGQIIQGDFSWFQNAWGNLVQWLADTWQNFKMDWTPHLKAVTDFLAGVLKGLSSFLQTPLGKIMFTLLGAYVGKKFGNFAGGGAGKAIGEFLGRRRIPGSKAIGGLIGEKLGGTLGGLTGMLAGGIGGNLTADTLSNVLSQGAASLSGGGTMAAAPAARQVAVHQGNKTWNMEIYQQPGENAEDFAARVAEIVEARDEARDLSLANELVQGGIPEPQ